MRMGRVDEKRFERLDILVEQSSGIRIKELSLDLTPGIEAASEDLKCEVN